MHLHDRTGLLRLDDIRVALKEGKKRFTAVNEVPVSICVRRNLGIIGENGCGKTFLCHCTFGFLDQDEWEAEGNALFGGHRIIAGKDGVRPGFCGTAAGFMAQDSAGALDPRTTLGGHFLGMVGVSLQSRQETLERTVVLLIRMGTRGPERALKDYVFQLSGGILQRVMTALVPLGKLRLLIADEPTTVLDIIIQREILGLLGEPKRE